jgi:hypothetical protein
MNPIAREDVGLLFLMTLAALVALAVLRVWGAI